MFLPGPMLKRLTVVSALAVAAIAGSTAAAGATEPAERFNAPGQRHVNVCVRIALPLAPLRYADATPTGFTLDDERTFSDRRCPAGTVRIDHHEQIPSSAGPLVFHRGGNGYRDAGNVKYGELATDEIATPLPAPVLSRGGRGAPCEVAADDPAWRVEVRSIPEEMHYKRPQDVASGSNRGASFEHYGDPAADQGDRRDVHYSYLLWSFVNVRGGGIVRTLLEPDRLVRLCDVAPVTMSSWDRAGAVNGQVTARYVKTMAGSCPLYGWMVWTHDDHTDASGPVAHARAESGAPPADPVAGAGCPAQEPAMPPGATTGAAYSVSDTAAGVTASVDPAGVPTSYRFEYGPAAGAYIASTPAVALGPDVRPVPTAASIGGLRPATTYHYRVVASNSHGATYGADAALTTASAYSPGTVPPPPPPPVELTELRVSPSAFRPARRRSGKATWIRWTASLSGSATFTFERRTTGMRLRGACRPAPPRGMPRRAKRCRRWHRVGGSLRAASGVPGRNALKWNGRLARRKLARGSYRISALPTGDDARTGAARHARFRVR